MVEAERLPARPLVFPSRRGDRKGEEKIEVSHAGAFRRDLRRAWGIERWGGRKQAFAPVREPTERERTVLDGDRYTLPVDWHSWRRAYSQALADAGSTRRTRARSPGTQA
jgi:hypothetical protein